MVGTTGSGKTTLARFLLARRRHIVVLDPKHGWTWGKTTTPTHRTAPETGITDDYRILLKHEGPEPIVYQPPSTMLRNGASGLGWFWDWIWDRENTTVYIDELFMVKKSSQELPYGFAQLIQQGRQKSIGVWCATQRPARVPIPPLSEAEHTFTFRLRHPADRKRMAEYTDPLIETDQATGHDFWYYCDTTQALFKTDVTKLKRKG